MNRQKTTHIIRKNIYILLVTVITLLVSWFAYYQWINWKEGKAEAALQEYHLTTIFHSSEARSDIFEIQNYLSFVSDAEQNDRETKPEHELSLHFFNIQKNLNTILELQRTFKSPEYESILERMEMQWNKLRIPGEQRNNVNNIMPEAEIKRQISQFLIAINQLQRLHIIQNNEISSKLLEQEKRDTVLSIIVFVVIMTIGFVFITKILGTTNKIMIEQEQDEAILRKHEASLLEAQRIARLGSWEWDIVNNKIYWSDEVYRIFGLKPQEFDATYEAVLNSVHPDDRELVEKTVNKALYEKKPYSINHRIVLPDDTERIVHGQGKVTYDKAGKPTQMIGTVQDITESKKMKDELIKAQKLEAMGTLAGGIAHDFSNSLQGILSNITLAKVYANPTDEIYEKLAKAEEIALQAKNLPKQLLTFSRGGAPIKKTVSVPELINDSISIALSGSNVRCEIYIPDGLKAVEADRGQIIQVINNLLINADHAMPHGGVIKVKAENINVGTKNPLLMKEGEYVRITIEDQGTGIPKEHLQRIFDPYFTTKKKGGGLGLAIAYSIIGKHDGHITAESIMEVGTTFHVYLPASRKKAMEKPVLNKARERGGEKVFPTGKRKVLLMDDEDMIRVSTSEHLKRLGYEAETAEDGSEAIKLYKSAMKSGKPFDAVVMDLTIHDGMGGEEAIKKLLEIDPNVKGIVASGYFNESIMSNFREYGFSGVIAKPYEIHELNKILQKVINAYT